LPNFAATIRRIARAVRVAKNYAVCRKALKYDGTIKGRNEKEKEQRGEKKPLIMISKKESSW